jgi:two-component system, NtrC family, sensor kinase
MEHQTAFEHNLLLRVGVIADGGRCLSIMRMLDSIKPSRLRLKLVALAPVNKNIVCLKFAGEMGVPIYDDYTELIGLESLDLILEMTGDPHILSRLAHNKSPSVGVLDQQASLLFFDIARQYEAAAERESEISVTTSFASALLEASPDGVMVVDRSYRIVNCNNSALITGGRPREEVIGKFCFEVIHGSLNPCSAKDCSCPTQETLKSRRPERSVHQVTTASGEILVLQFIAFPLFNMLGEIVQFVEIVRDITSDLSVHVEKRAKAIKDDLARVVQEDRLASIGRLVASVCHEINNPIASIVTFNKLILSHIRDGTLPPAGQADFSRYLELSVREAMRCGEIVKNLLTFARQKNIEAGPVDLREVVRTIMLLTAHQLEMSQAKVELNLPQTPLLAWCDYALIQQCLMNLIFNAMEAISGGGVITIAGGSETSRGKVWLTISDTGSGIDPEDLSRIFEPFYSTKTASKGVGLGLSMVYGIIREHNGTIEVSSEPGHGAAFKIVLPVNPVVTAQAKGDSCDSCNANSGCGR